MKKYRAGQDVKLKFTVIFFVYLVITVLSPFKLPPSHIFRMKIHF